MRFDNDKKYLGKLCKHGHEYQSTGKSLRRKSDRTCVQCRIDQTTRWASENPAKRHIANRNADWKNNDIKITWNQYQELYNAQNGCCMICNQYYSVLDVDHDHETGVVRGLLCNNCNKALGLFKDSIDNLQSAVLYLEKFK